MPTEQLKMKLELEALLSEVEAIDAETFKPREEPRHGEKILVQSLDEDLRKLWALCDFYEREAKIKTVELEYNEDGASQAHLLMCKEEALRDLFWFIARSRYNLFNLKVIGLRKNWVVVEAVPTAESMLARLLRGGI